MSLIVFPKDVLRRMPRPQPQYFRQMEKCAVSVRGDDLVFDRESECWIRLKKQYADAPPAPLDSYREIQERTNGKRKSLVRRTGSFLKALATGKKVSPEVLAERKVTCAECPLMQGGRCSICGCGVGAEFGQVMNLAAYEENLPEWGCKHPDRAKGLGWRR